jgi:hypothetical protein
MKGMSRKKKKSKKKASGGMARMARPSPMATPSERKRMLSAFGAPATMSERERVLRILEEEVDGR